MKKTVAAALVLILLISGCQNKEKPQPTENLTLRHGVDWGAPDARAVDLLFMIAVPPGNESLHLQILARLVNLLSRNSLVDALRHASSPERFVELIAKTENACFAD